MANPLQPKVLNYLESIGAYAININAASKSGHMDVVACIGGLFYGFEIKWKTDTPSALQRQKINACIDAKGRAYFIRSIPQLKDIIENNIAPIKYDLTFEKFSL